MKHVLKSNLKNKNGFTLIELIVTFALTAILLTSATMVLSSYMRNYTWCNATIQGKSISDILMESMTGEISQAMKGKAYPHDKGENTQLETVLENSNLILSGEIDKSEIYRKLTFVNKNGNNMEIGIDSDNIFQKAPGGKELDNKTILLRYTTYAEDSKGMINFAKLKTIDWYHSQKVYKGNEVTELTFQFLDKPKLETDPAEDRNASLEGERILIQINLTIRNIRLDIEYKTSQIVECYNLEGAKAAMVNKVIMNKVAEDNPSNPSESSSS